MEGLSQMLSPAFDTPQELRGVEGLPQMLSSAFDTQKPRATVTDCIRSSQLKLQHRWGTSLVLPLTEKMGPLIVSEGKGLLWRGRMDTDGIPMLQWIPHMHIWAALTELSGLFKKKKKLGELLRGCEVGGGRKWGYLWLCFIVYRSSLQVNTGNS